MEDLKLEHSQRLDKVEGQNKYLLKRVAVLSDQMGWLCEASLRHGEMQSCSPACQDPDVSLATLRPSVSQCEWLAGCLCGAYTATRPPSSCT